MAPAKAEAINFQPKSNNPLRRLQEKANIGLHFTVYQRIIVVTIK